MKKYFPKNIKENKITINKTNYAFVVHEEGIGIRRVDQKAPTQEEVEKITMYVINEGWADDVYFNNEDFGGLV